MLFRSISVSGLACAHVAAGRKPEAQKLLEELTESSRCRYVPAYFVGAIHVALGDWQAALPWLEQSCEERSMALAFSRTDPSFDPYRSDPRYLKLLRRMGLPE